MSITQEEIGGEKKTANQPRWLAGLNKIIAHFYPAYSIMLQTAY
jgi:hypothetical protein